jgi:hypothetical protein
LKSQSAMSMRSIGTWLKLECERMRSVIMASC